MQTLHIQLLGNFRLRQGNEPVTKLNTPRLQALLAYLVLHRDAPVLRQYLAFQFWPDSSESQARTNLRKLFFQLQRALPDANGLLVANTLNIGWHTQARFTLDIAELQQVLTHLTTEPLDLNALRRVVELYQGPLLPSCYDDWIAPLRQQLHQAVMDALERLITLLENQRAYSAGIRYAQRLLTFDPLEEKTYQRLMRLHALDGDYTSALRVYQDCVAVLQRELEVEPDPETQALYERLRRRDGASMPKVDEKPRQAEHLPLVGRQREWQTLQNSWRKAVQGAAHGVWIWGEAGIGKTRLAEELLDWAAQQGILTARTRAYQAQGALAYAPVTLLLRSPTLSSQLVKVGPQWLSEVARLLPELLEQYPGLATPQPMNESWQRQRFFEALARAVLVDDQPLLLLVDDLHWCDPETLAWLNYLLHFAPKARLLVVGTSRVEEVQAEHPLTPLRLALRRAALLTEIELTPLSANEVTVLAQKVTDDALTVEQTNQLYTDTEGNPLFVVETVRAGLSKAVGEWENRENREEVQPPTALPPKVYAVIRSRLTRLSPQAQKIVSLAATIGRSFTYTVLTAAAHTDEETIIAGLDELWERRIVREQGVDAYDFSHDRIRDVAYAELSRARRRQLHRHVAEALETVYGSSLDEISAVLADQWEQASNQDKAVTYLQRAGAHAATYYLHAEATRYFNRALDLTPPKHYAKICQLLLARERIYDLSGNRAAQKKDLALLQEILSTWLDDPQQALVIRAEVAVRLSRYERRLANVERAITYAQQAVELAQADNAAPQKANGLLEWGMSLWNKANFAAAREQLARALATAEKANLPSCLAESLERLAQVDMFTGGSASGIMQYMERALENYAKAGDLIGKCSILNKLGYLPVAQGVGEYTQAREHYEQGLALSRKIGDRSSEGNILRNLGILSVCEGDYAQAERTLDAARQIYTRLGAKDGLAVVLNCLGFTYLNKGQLAQAKSVQTAALQQFRQQQSGQWEVKSLTSLGWIHLMSGDLALALDYATEAHQTSQVLNEQRQAAYALTCMGHVLTQLYRYPEAITAFQEAVTLHQQMQQDNPSMAPLAGLAQVALVQGDMSRAQSLVEKILSHLAIHKLDRTEEALRVYLTCYHVLRATDDQRAHEMLHTAYAQLQTRAASIDEPEAQRHFWEAIRDHAEVRQAIVG